MQVPRFPCWHATARSEDVECEEEEPESKEGSAPNENNGSNGSNNGQGNGSEEGKGGTSRCAGVYRGAPCVHVLQMLLFTLSSQMGSIADNVHSAQCETKKQKANA